MSDFKQFINDLKTEPIEYIFLHYTKPNLIKYAKQLGIDATSRNTKDELYRRILQQIQTMDENLSPSQGFLNRGG